MLRSHVDPPLHAECGSARSTPFRSWRRPLSIGNMGQTYTSLLGKRTLQNAAPTTHAHNLHAMNSHHQSAFLTRCCSVNQLHTLFPPPPFSSPLPHSHPNHLSLPSSLPHPQLLTDTSLRLLLVHMVAVRSSRTNTYMHRVKVCASPPPLFIEVLGLYAGPFPPSPRTRARVSSETSWQWSASQMVRWSTY